jgi:hypothetical protein
MRRGGGPPINTWGTIMSAATSIRAEAQSGNALITNDEFRIIDFKLWLTKRKKDPPRGRKRVLSDNLNY